MDKIYVAKLGRAVGLHGDLKIYIDSDFPEQFKKDTRFTTQKNQTLTIESFSPKSETIKFVGINTIDDAKKLTNKLLYTNSENTKQNCKLEKNQYFWFDLIECTLIENNEILGTIVDIQRLPLDDYFVIETSQELQKQNFTKQFLLPYNEQYVQSVDIDNKQIIVTNAKDILEAS